MLQAPMQNKFTDIIKSFQDLNNYIKPETDNPDLIGTAIPYLYSMYGDLALNPSTVSTSEFQKMAYGDPTVYSCLKYLVILVVNRIKQYEHKNEEVKNLINYSLDNLRIGKLKFLETMLAPAAYAGFSVGEKVYGTYKNKIVITDIAPLPPSSIIFRIDTNGFVKEDGIVQYYYNNLLTGYSNLLSYNSPTGGPNPMARKGDLDYPLRTPFAQPVGTVLIPKNKCIHFTMHGIDGLTNPYGRSLCRSIYQHYTNKQAALQITLIGANYKSSPMAVFYVDPTANVQLPDGTTLDIASDLHDNLTNLKGNGFVIIQGRKQMMVDHDVINNTADLSQFVNLLSYYNNEIKEGLLTPNSLMGNSENGSYALGLTQSSAHGKYIDYITQSMCDCLIEQFVKPLIKVNFKSETDWGYFKIAEETLADKERYAKILEASTKTGYVNMSELKDYNWAREKIGAQPVEELPDIFKFDASEQSSEYDTTNRNVNIMKTRQETGQPYARRAL